ncbi:MAG TPA: RHS repeat-associated core domain-containing protein, partial [Nitrososphaera sp.]|nr:RHS repeat-associated core domain-containing protein [Nitrososphaera sp.]
DSELGLYFYKARYYSPAIGRFLQPDPLGYAGGDLNLYTYAFCNPLSLTDPRGLIPEARPDAEEYANYMGWWGGSAPTGDGYVVSPTGLITPSNLDYGAGAESGSSKPDGGTNGGGGSSRSGSSNGPGEGRSNGPSWLVPGSESNPLFKDYPYMPPGWNAGDPTAREVIERAREDEAFRKLVFPEYERTKWITPVLGPMPAGYGPNSVSPNYWEPNGPFPPRVGTDPQQGTPPGRYPVYDMSDPSTWPYGLIQEGGANPRRGSTM